MIIEIRVKNKGIKKEALNYDDGQIKLSYYSKENNLDWLFH